MIILKCPLFFDLILIIGNPMERNPLFYRLIYQRLHEKGIKKGYISYRHLCREINHLAACGYLELSDQDQIVYARLSMKGHKLYPIIDTFMKSAIKNKLLVDFHL